MIARYDLESGEIKEWEYLGKKYDVVTIDDLYDEMTDLEMKANFGKVTGKEYGRIKEIQSEMQMHRYMRCVESGMDENRASYAFDT